MSAGCEELRWFPGKRNVILSFPVDKKNKVKVHAINFDGNKDFSDARLKKFMKKNA